jgi:hypothetical protein
VCIPFSNMAVLARDHVPCRVPSWLAQLGVCVAINGKYPCALQWDTGL